MKKIIIAAVLLCGFTYRETAKNELWQRRGVMEKIDNGYHFRAIGEWQIYVAKATPDTVWQYTFSNKKP